MTIDQFINVLATVTLFEMMVTIGLGVTFTDVVGVARKWQMVGKAALANYLCVPAAAVALLLLFHANPYIAAGFLIAAVCPGAPYGPPFTGMAKGNVPASVGLMILLAGSSRVAAPPAPDLPAPVHPWVPTAFAGGEQAARNRCIKVVSTLLLSQMFRWPLGWRSGSGGRPCGETQEKTSRLLSMVLNLGTLGVILSVQFEMLVAIPLRGYMGMAVLVAAGVAAGWALGRARTGNRTAMTMATSGRNVGVSLVIATGSFGGTQAVTAATAFAIFQTVVMALVALVGGVYPRPRSPRHRPNRKMNGEPAMKAITVEPMQPGSVRLEEFPSPTFARLRARRGSGRWRLRHRHRDCRREVRLGASRQSSG